MITYEFEITGVITETDKATLFDVVDKDLLENEGDDGVWVPKKLIENESDDSVEVPNWWAREKGWT